MVYIRQSQLPKLKEYKYSGTLRDTDYPCALRDMAFNQVVLATELS
jgi:hypothetical protein